jgi:hypothetical protein
VSLLGVAFSESVGQTSKPSSEKESTLVDEHLTRNATPNNDTGSESISMRLGTLPRLSASLRHRRLFSLLVLAACLL